MGSARFGEDRMVVRRRIRIRNYEADCCEPKQNRYAFQSDRELPISELVSLLQNGAHEAEIAIISFGLGDLCLVERRDA
jgi:hypothetical protein